jgi:nucleoside-triphosphatase
VAGVTSPAVMNGQHKVGIDLVDLATGERQRLAESKATKDEGETTERWRFREETLGWGGSVLNEAATRHADLLVVDELGPLEFHRGTGLTAGLTAVDGGLFGVACVVVRPSLLDAALARWPDAVVVDVED